MTSSVYRPYVGTHVTSNGVRHWIEEAAVEEMGSRVYVRVGKTLLDNRDEWHDCPSAAMDDAAARIDALADALVRQATEIRRAAAELRAKAVEVPQ